MMYAIFFLAVEFDFSGNYLAIGGSDIRYVLVTCNYWYLRVEFPGNVVGIPMSNLDRVYRPPLCMLVT